MMDLNLDDLRRLAGAAQARLFAVSDPDWLWRYYGSCLVHAEYKEYLVALHPQTTLALLDTIAELRRKLKQQIDNDNVLVRQLRQEKEAAENRERALRQRLQQQYETA